MVSSIQQNHNSGILSIDALFSFVPLILMLSFALNLVASLSIISAENFHHQQVFDKLVSIADYSMKIGLATDGVHNWIGVKEITSQYLENMRIRTQLSRLTISDTASEGYSTCVTRLGVTGPSKDVIKLYFCGD